MRQYLASASPQPRRTLAAITRSISAKAISGLDRAARYSTGTPARFKRTGLLVQLSGTKRRNFGDADFVPHGAQSARRFREVHKRVDDRELASSSRGAREDQSPDFRIARAHARPSRCAARAGHADPGRSEPAKKLRSGPHRLTPCMRKLRHLSCAVVTFEDQPLPTFLRNRRK